MKNYTDASWFSDEDEDEPGEQYEKDLEGYIRQAERLAGGKKGPVRVDALKIYPYPEILRRSKAFKVVGSKDETAGATNLLSRTMIVPLHDTEQAAFVRDHEGDHALFSEHMTKAQKDLGMIMAAVEDGRISLMHRAAGWDFKPDPIVNKAPEVLENLKKTVTAYSSYPAYKETEKAALLLATALVASAGDTTNLPILKKALKASLDPVKGKKKLPHWNKAVKLAEKLTGQTLAIMGRPENAPHLRCRTCKRRKTRGQRPIPCVHPDRALAAAKWLEKWRVKEGVPQMSSLGSGMASNCQGHGAKKPKTEDLPSYKWVSGQRDEGGVFKPHGEKLPDGINPDRWGTMTVQSPPRNHRAIPRNKSTPLVYSRKMGVVPDRIHNWCTGRRVFSWAQPEGNKGGSILIDCSASMGFAKETLLSFVKAAPALTVAGYSGYGDNGALRIWIKSGKIVADEYLVRPGGGNNVVDGPAIEWLSRQKGPRFWVSERHMITVIPELEMAERVLVKHYGGK